MELIKIKNASQNLYEELVLEKDRLKKMAVIYRMEYYRVFGEKIIQNFQQKIRCIELKKKIAYCQAMMNSGKEIHEHELRSFIQRQMKDYYSSLENIINYTTSIQSTIDIPEIELRKIKKLYREMAKMLHPDLHPELQSDPKIAELWTKIVTAYECNDLEELEELSFMVRRYLNEHEQIEIEDIEDKIEKLQDEIHTIKNTDPYQFKYLLEDPLMVEDKFKDLEREFKEYVDYEAELLIIYQRFDVKGVLN